jgi:hypothetical protein
MDTELHEMDIGAGAERIRRRGVWVMGAGTRSWDGGFLHMQHFNLFFIFSIDVPAGE